MTDSILTVIELIGIISFAISGAIVAIDKGMDLFGVLFLSLLTSFGGGIIRDLVLDREVAFFGALVEKHYITVCAAVSLMVFLFARFFARWYLENEKRVLRVNNFIDAMGIGAFCVSTIRICLNLNPDISPFFAISMSLITAVGGGMIRDVCLNDIPFVLRKHVYAVACIVGSAFYYVCAAVLFRDNEIADVLCAVIAILLVFVIRVLATVFRWNFPRALPVCEKNAGESSSKNNLCKTDKKSHS